MPKVVIESLEGPSKTVTIDATKGGALVDLCDENPTPVPFSCRSASCGTCRIDVLEGSDQLLPPKDEELDILDVFGDDPKKRRLACQAEMRPGLTLLRVRPVPVDV
jgi:2Fe-2S ferredoxin